MNQWLQRWQMLAPREQWLLYGGSLLLAGMLYLLLLGDPLSLRLTQQQAALSSAQARQLEAQNGLAELQAKLAADPNLPYRSALLAAQAGREQLLAQIDGDTSVLLKPEQMPRLLRDLLQSQPRLQLLGLESFSEPLQLPEPAAPAAAGPTASGKPETPPPAPLTLYRHGVSLTLEGGYFDLLSYLQAIQDSGWKLHWDSLDYRVGKAGPAQAKIRLKLYTLSREAGWVGV